MDIKDRLHRGGVVDIDAGRAHWEGDPRECRTWGAVRAASRRACSRQQFRGEASQRAPLAPLQLTQRGEDGVVDVDGCACHGS